MKLEIISPDKNIFKGTVSSVKVSGEKSPFQILKGHAPIISTLVKGNISIKIETTEFLNNEFKNNLSDKNLSFIIKSGIIKGENDMIEILLD